MVFDQGTAFQQSWNWNNDFFLYPFDQDQQNTEYAVRAINQEIRCFRFAFQRGSNNIMLYLIQSDTIAKFIRRGENMGNFRLFWRSSLLANLKLDQKFCQSNSLRQNQRRTVSCQYQLKSIVQYKFYVLEVSKNWTNKLFHLWRLYSSILVGSMLDWYVCVFLGEETEVVRTLHK